MKRLIFTLFSVSIIALSALSAVTTVPVVTQLTANEKDKLPDKTIETTFKALRFKTSSSTPIVMGMEEIMQVTCDNAFQCRTFTLDLRQCNDSVMMTVKDIDPTELGEKHENYLGTLVKEGRHFIVICDAANSNLVKSAVEPARDKVKYVKEYEFVEEVQPVQATLVEGTMHRMETTINTCIVEGEKYENAHW